MSDLRFIEELGAEFERVAELRGPRRGTRASRRLAPALGYALATLAVVAVIAVAFALKGHGGPSPSAGAAEVRVTFRIVGTPPVSALQRSLTILRERLQNTFKDAQVQLSGAQVSVAVGPARRPGSLSRARVIALAAPGALAFYDWEASALTPGGKTVASRIGSRDPTALTISQGSAGGAPGNAGGMPLDQARKLAAAHRGTIVLRSGSRFFVLEHRPALTNADITKPVAATDQSGEPAVTFGFTRNGAAAFQRLTAGVAHRGVIVSGLGETLNQHFAVTVDHLLLTVPSIDFKTYPDGVPGNNGADIVGGLTAQSARDLATLLRYGPLAVRVIPVAGP